MPDFRFLLKVSRPRFWLYVFGPYIIGLAAEADNHADFLLIENLIFAIYFLFPANLLIYGINDIFDFETDRLNPKKAEYEALVRPESHRSIFIWILIFNLPFVIAAGFTDFKTFLLLLGFLFFSVFYSAPPIRAKALPLIDSLFNILYVFPGLFAYRLMSGQNPPLAIIAAAGLWTMAMHAYSAIPDIEADSEANLKTIATSLGKHRTLIICLVLYLTSACLTYEYLGILSIILGLVYAVLIFVSFYNQDKIFKIYQYFPLLNAASGFVLFWFTVLSNVRIIHP